MNALATNAETTGDSGVDAGIAGHDVRTVIATFRYRAAAQARHRMPVSVTASTRNCHENRAARRAERLAHADLARALGHRDHHDRDHADAADEQADRRQRDADDEERAEQLVVDVEKLVLRDDGEVRRARLGWRPR